MPINPNCPQPHHAWLASALILATLAGCGGGGGSSPSAVTPTPPPAIAEGALRPAASGDIATYFRARIERSGEPAAQPALSPATATSDATQGTTTLFAGAPLQEQGVDEEDLLKASGSMLYALHLPRSQPGAVVAARLSASRVQADGTLAPLGQVTLPSGQTPQGMYLVPDAGRLAVLSQARSDAMILPMPTTADSSLPTPFGSTPAISVQLYSAPEGAVPGLQQRVEFDGRLVGSRRIGNVLYVVSNWAPPLNAYRPSAGSTPEQVRAALARLDSAALLPRVRVNGGEAQPLVQEPACLLQPDNASLALQVTTIIAFDLGTPDAAPVSRCVVGDSSAIYMSPKNLYLATSRQAWIAAANSLTVFPEQTSTDIHKFALDGTRIDYRGSGQVRGHLGWDPEKLSRRMSEHEGLLRVVTYTGQTGHSSAGSAAAPSPATLTVLREDAASRSLATVATLPNSSRPAPIGHAGEQVYAVHFAGPRAYAVTFRRTDPLYVIDLSNAADPKVAGELQMPGYSDYLFPLDSGTLLGIGRDATADGVVGGIKLALLDVRDATQPRVLSQRVLGSRGSYSALDHSRRGISILPVANGARVALPAWLADATGYPNGHGLLRFEADLSAGTLTERPLVPASATGFQWFTSLAGERALQTVRGSYYLSAEDLIFTPAP